MDAKRIARFWARVDKRSPDECWEWTGERNKDLGGHGNYGRFWALYKHYLAHRLAWELTHGPLPTDLCVLHRCDNPPCCNPAHLFLGTRLDNNRDKAAKGRTNPTRGARHHKARLSEAQARDVFRRLAAGERIVDIARRYDVSPSAVILMKKGRNWKHLNASSARAVEHRVA